MVMKFDYSSTTRVTVSTVAHHLGLPHQPVARGPRSGVSGRTSKLGHVPQRQWFREGSTTTRGTLRGRHAQCQLLGERCALGARASAVRFLRLERVALGVDLDDPASPSDGGSNILLGLGVIRA